jgi:hypothetical protein
MVRISLPCLTSGQHVNWPRSIKVMNATGVLLKLLFVMILICTQWLTGIASLERIIYCTSL